MNPTLTKMVIEIYSDARYSKKTTQYPILFNPENYSLNWAFTFTDDETATGGNAPCELKSINRSEFTMTFIIDGTGIGAAALGRENIAVVKEVWDFLEITTVMNRDGTRKAAPPFCRLVWGNLCARCFIKQVKLDINLLDRTGKALRAALATTFRAVYPSLPSKGKK